MKRLINLTFQHEYISLILKKEEACTKETRARSKGGVKFPEEGGARGAAGSVEKKNYAGSRRRVGVKKQGAEEYITLSGEMKLRQGAYKLHHTSPFFFLLTNRRRGGVRKTVQINREEEEVSLPAALSHPKREKEKRRGVPYCCSRSHVKSKLGVITCKHRPPGDRSTFETR